MMVLFSFVRVISLCLILGVYSSVMSSEPVHSGANGRNHTSVSSRHFFAKRRPASHGNKPLIILPPPRMVLPVHLGAPGQPQVIPGCKCIGGVYPGSMGAPLKSTSNQQISQVGGSDQPAGEQSHSRPDKWPKRPSLGNKKDKENPKKAAGPADHDRPWKAEQDSSQGGSPFRPPSDKNDSPSRGTSQNGQKNPSQDINQGKGPYPKKETGQSWGDIQNVPGFPSLPSANPGASPDLPDKPIDKNNEDTNTKENKRKPPIQVIIEGHLETLVDHLLRYTTDQTIITAFLNFLQDSTRLIHLEALNNANVNKNNIFLVIAKAILDSNVLLEDPRNTLLITFFKLHIPYIIVVERYFGTYTGENIVISKFITFLKDPDRSAVVKSLIETNDMRTEVFIKLVQQFLNLSDTVTEPGYTEFSNFFKSQYQEGKPIQIINFSD